MILWLRVLILRLWLGVPHHPGVGPQVVVVVASGGHGGQRKEGNEALT